MGLFLLLQAKETAAPQYSTIWARSTQYPLLLSSGFSSFDSKVYLNTGAKIKKQTIDPANGEIPLRKFIDPKDFFKIVGWENGDFQIKKALEVFRKG